MIVFGWMNRLEGGEVRTIERQPIVIPLSDKIIKTGIKTFGDFSQMNARINSANSSTSHERFEKDPKEWEQYHALYREARKDWPIIPYDELIQWCRKRPELVIGDFGCGEAKLAEALEENTVHSFDHVAIDPKKVIACDMSHVPLEDESLDIAIFSLSLMGRNFTDYVVEAHRCLKLDGTLWIVEATSRFSNLDNFLEGLKKLGLDILTYEEKYKFIFIRAVKNDQTPIEEQLRF